MKIIIPVLYLTISQGLLVPLLLFQIFFHKSITSSTFALSSTSTTSAKNPIQSTNTPENSSRTNLDIERVQATIANGRVYQHENFINETQVQAILDDIERLRKENIMKPSGLSNTLKKQNQNFGEEDRTTAPAPWWRESLQRRSDIQQGGNQSLFGKCEDSELSNSSDSDRTSCQNIDAYDDLLKSVIWKIQDLRGDVSILLNRNSMRDATLAHECYYSRSTEGAFLPRHMDERHEELKGPRGWMLPSRRSISWLIYLSDEDLVGGELRTFPQKNFLSSKHGMIESGCHNGNLQIGWVDIELPTATSESLPVYLDSWYKPSESRVSDEDIPLCILYTVSDNNNEIIYITKPWSNNSVTMGTPEFIKDLAERSSKGEPNFFTDKEYGRGFRLLEDREAWSGDESRPPSGSEPADIIPKRGSLVMFDSVTLPHEVLVVKKNTRSALAGWFHEETQDFPSLFS